MQSLVMRQIRRHQISAPSNLQYSNRSQSQLSQPLSTALQHHHHSTRRLHFLARGAFNKAAIIMDYPSRFCLPAHFTVHPSNSSVPLTGVLVTSYPRTLLPFHITSIKLLDLIFILLFLLLFRANLTEPVFTTTERSHKMEREKKRKRKKCDKRCCRLFLKGNGLLKSVKLVDLTICLHVNLHMKFLFNKEEENQKSHERKGGLTHYFTSVLSKF